MGENILLVAFDGLDYELIKKFEPDNIPQSEFGKIDNQKGITEVKTNELFASLITGDTWREHGVKGMEVRTARTRLIDFIFPDFLEENYRRMRMLKDFIKNILHTGIKGRRYRREDWNSKTLFEKIKDSKAMFVPAYNPSVVFGSHMDFLPLKYGYSSAETLKFWDTREYEYRKRSLFDEIEGEDCRRFLMFHFHRPDIHQHHYGDKELVYDQEQLRKLYSEIDQVAGRIKDKATESGYDYIIFMSDHGLPTATEHNANAFYSSNKELFGDDVPHITDFYDRILQITENE